MSERTYFGTAGDAVLICEEPGRDGAVVYMFDGYPKDGENVMTMSVSNVDEYIGELNAQEYVIPEIWEAGGSRFIRVPRMVGASARDIATRALHHTLYQARSNRYDKLVERAHSVSFFTEDASRVTFIENDRYQGDEAYSLTEDELETASDETGMSFDAIQAYARAFGTTDLGEFESDYFVGELDGGNTLEEWYLAYIEDYEIMVGRVSVVVSDMIEQLNNLGLTVEVTDTVLIDQDFTEQDGFVFRVH